MLKTNLIGAVSAASLVLLSQGANAVITYDANVTSDAIFGSGNVNGSYTVDTANNVELGLRGKLRHNGVGAPENTFNSNGDGTYTFLSGVAPTQVSPTAVWSFEWSINTNQDGTSNNARHLSDLTYVLGLDNDPSLGTNYITFDPISTAGGTTWWDHSIGDNTTGNGAGTEATDLASYVGLIGANSLAQNSWKAHWYIPGFDPTVNGEYKMYLAAFDGATQLARTDIIINTIPVPAAAWLLGSAFGMLGLARRKVNIT